MPPSTYNEDSPGQLQKAAMHDQNVENYKKEVTVLSMEFAKASAMT